MKISRKVSLATRRVQISRSLIIFCGLLCTSAWWAYVVSVASSGAWNASTTTSSGYSPSAAVDQNDENEIKNYSVTAQTTGNSFDGKNLTHDVLHHRSININFPSRANRMVVYLNHSAPVSSLIYPLHAKSGTYHAYVYIGTPPQRQTLIVDTGSRLTAFPCHPHCPDCGPHTTKPFHLNQSSSYKIVSCEDCRLAQSDFPFEDYFAGDDIGGNSGDGGPPPRLRSNKQNPTKMQQQRRYLFPNSCVNDRCEVDQRYTEGSSWRAFEVEDKVWLGLNDTAQSTEVHDKFSAPFVFGCQISEQGLFKSQYADGIMGLSMYTQTLVDVWVQSGSIAHRSFSLCLNQESGLIALGGTALTHKLERNQSHGMHLSPMQFTPFAKENVWYYTVTVTSISVGKHMLPAGILQFVNDHKGTIIDSGTTDTFISHKVAKVRRFEIWNHRWTLKLLAPTPSFVLPMLHCKIGIYICLARTYWEKL